MGLSLPHLIILAIIWAVWIVPLYRILGRLGFAKWWAFLAFPPAGMVILWVLAFTRWQIADAYEEPTMPNRG